MCTLYCHDDEHIAVVYWRGPVERVSLNVRLTLPGEAPGGEALAVTHAVRIGRACRGLARGTTGRQSLASQLSR